MDFFYVNVKAVDIAAKPENILCNIHSLYYSKHGLSHTFCFCPPYRIASTSSPFSSLQNSAPSLHFYQVFCVNQLSVISPDLLLLRHSSRLRKFEISPGETRQDWAHSGWYDHRLSSWNKNCRSWRWRETAYVLLSMVCSCLTALHCSAHLFCVTLICVLGIKRDLLCPSL